MSTNTQRLDLEMGELIRLHRLAAGVSQIELGQATGISYQQIQKYEAGQNRLSISRLFMIAKALGSTPSALISQLEERAGVESDLNRPEIVENLKFLASNRGRRVVRALASCEDPRILDAVADLFIATSDAMSDPGRLEPKSRLRL